MRPGILIIGQVLCHSGSLSGPSIVIFGSTSNSDSPSFFNSNIKSSSQSLICVLRFSLSFLASKVFLERSTNLAYNCGSMNGIVYMSLLSILDFFCECTGQLSQC